MGAIEKKRLFWIIVLIGVVIRTCLVFFSSDLNAGTDAWKYDRIAQNIAFKGIYSAQKIETSNPEPTVIYPPLYPGLLASVYYIFGYQPLLINYLHIVLYVIACIAIFKLSTVLFNEATGAWAVLFFTLEPIAVLCSIIAMPEILLAIFLPLSIYFLIKFLKQDNKNRIRYKDLVLSNITVAVAMLAKPITFYFPLFSILFIFIYWRRSIKRAILASLITTIVTGLIISPWIIRNYKIWNKFCFVKMVGFVSPEKESVLEKIYYTKRRLRRNVKSIGMSAIRYIFGTSTIMFYRKYDRGGKLHKYYTDQKTKCRPTINDYRNLFRYSWKFAVFELLLLAILLAIYLFALQGAVFMLKNGKTQELLLLIFVIAYFAVIILLDVTANSRHRFPSIPFYSILAGYGLNRLLSFRNKSV